MIIRVIFILLLLTNSTLAQEFKTIQTIDLGDESAPKATHAAIEFKFKVPSYRLTVGLNQFVNRIRLVLDGEGLPRGEYGFYVARDCKTPATEELCRFQWDAVRVIKEKSLPKASLYPSKRKTTVLVGKSLALVRIVKKKHEVMACEAIRP